MRIYEITMASLDLPWSQVEMLSRAYGEPVGYDGQGLRKHVLSKFDEKGPAGQKFIEQRMASVSIAIDATPDDIKDARDSIHILMGKHKIESHKPRSERAHV